MLKPPYREGDIGKVLSERDVIVKIDVSITPTGKKFGQYHLAKETVLISPPIGGYGELVEVPHYQVLREASQEDMYKLPLVTPSYDRYRA